MVAIFAEGSSNRLQLSSEEFRLFLNLLDLLASTHDDLNNQLGALHYYERLIEYDKCALLRTTNATLEHEYCSGRLYSRAILIYRHHLRREDLAMQAWQRATAHKFLGERVHWWPNSWQIPTMHMRGLRSQPFWEGPTKPPLATFLEAHFDTIRKEFLAVLAHPEHSRSFGQNDHSLITAGTWGELKLFDGKEWKQVCKDVTPKTCALLRKRPELVGKMSTSRTHHVSLPKEAGYFRLLPGTRLKPHTGPVNFHLYCHLGLLVPEGPWLRVGGEQPRRWTEGASTCFDDSYDHEAWHNGTKARYVLMITFWHPDLGETDPL